MWEAGWSRVTHPFATLWPSEEGLIVRLACVKHAASVHPEPGSNSLNKCLLQVKINSWLIYPFYCFLRIFRSFVFMILKRTFEECVSLFSYQRSVLHCRLSQTALLLYHVVSCLSRTFFNFFEVVFVSLLQQLWYFITSNRLLSRTFYFFLTALWSLRDLSDATLIGYHRRLDLSTSFYYFSCNLFIRVNHYISDSFLVFIKR